MTEHGWPDHHDDVPEPVDDLFVPVDDQPVDDQPVDDLPEDDLPGEWDVPEPDPAPAEAQHDLPAGPDPLPMPDGPALDGPASDGPVADGPPVGADPDAVAEPADPPAVFPPALDVGPLPEPVDGFPWIDTGSLGAAGLAAAAAEPAGAPTAQDLAAYAAADLPPGVDPWAALEASDDPATAALARFYRPGDTSPDS